MGVSKVVYGDDTLVDLTGDTVTPTSLTLGATAHGADGEPIVGEYQYVLPPMSSDIRGGARIQPDSGLEITDTDNLQVRLALESDGTVRGGIAELTAKGHAEQDGTPTPDNPVPIQVVTGHTVTGKTGRFVDLEVRNASDQLLSTTPIPLPQRGWVAGLRDGTADSLRLDGAGKCEWTLPTKMLDLGELAWVTGTDSIGQYFRSYISGRLVVNTLLMKDKALCSKLLITDSGNVYDKSLGFSSSDTTIYARDLSSADVSAFIANVGDASLLYPLATPVTEDCGYVEDWPTDLPEGATLSIRELDSVGIKYFIDSSVTELAKQWYARAQSEYEDRLQALESAVSDLATGA